MTQNIAFPVIDMRATGENIRKLREQNGMKVRDLQEIFGFTSPMSIYKWQEGKTLPDYANLLLLTDLWNVRVEDILVRENRDIFSFSSVSENENPSQIILLKSTSRTGLAASTHTAFSCNSFTVSNLDDAVLAIRLSFVSFSLYDHGGITN